MTRIERLSAILIQLQGKRVVTGAEIARRFGVSLRTVYRDIRSLEEAGVPIGAEGGRGYYLVEGYSLPPVAFTAEEASALVTAGMFIGQLADESVLRQYDSAVSKVMAVMDPKGKAAMEALTGRLEVFAAPAVRPQAPYLTDIQSAICAGRVLSIRYAASGHDPSVRDVEPLLLFFYDMRWFLYAFCRLRRAYRSFRTDRIIDLVVREESFDNSLDRRPKDSLFQALRLREAPKRHSPAAVGP